jgi:hypothetical protein
MYRLLNIQAARQYVPSAEYSGAVAVCTVCLTFRHSPLYPRSAVCFMWSTQFKAVVSLSRTNLLIFLIEVQFVFWEVGIEFFVCVLITAVHVMFGVQCQDYDCAVLHVVFAHQHVTSCTALKGGFVNRVTQTHCILPRIGTYWADWAVRCWWACSELFVSL